MKVVACETTRKSAGMSISDLRDACDLRFVVRVVEGGGVIGAMGHDELAPDLAVVGPLLCDIRPRDREHPAHITGGEPGLDRRPYLGGGRGRSHGATMAASGSWFPTVGLTSQESRSHIASTGHGPKERHRRLLISNGSAERRDR